MSENHPCQGTQLGQRSLGKISALHIPAPTQLHTESPEESGIVHSLMVLFQSLLLRPPTEELAGIVVKMQNSRLNSRPTEPKSMHKEPTVSCEQKMNEI